MATNFGLGFTIRATDLASGVLRRIGGGFARLGHESRMASSTVAASVGALAGGVVSLQTGVAGLNFALSQAVKAGDFGQELAFLGNVTERTGTQLEELRERALDAAAISQFSPEEAIAGMKELVTGGMNASKAMESLDATLMLAQFGSISVAESSRALITSVNAFSKEALSAEQIVDKYAQILNTTNLQSQDFEAGLAVAAGTFSTYNQTLDETLIGLGLLRNAGIGASRASTDLRESLRRMMGDKSVQKYVTEGLGVKLFEETGPNVGRERQYHKILFDLHAAIKKLSPAQQAYAKSYILGARGIAVWGAIAEANYEIIENGTKKVLKGAQVWEYLAKKQLEAVGAAKTLNDAMLDTFGGQWKLMRGMIEGFALEFGSSVGEIFKDVIYYVRAGSDLLLRVLMVIPKSLKVAAAGMFMAGSATLVFAGSLLVLVGVFVPLMAFLGVTLGMVLALTAGFTAFLVIGASLTAAVGAFGVRFVNSLGPAKRFAENFSENVSVLYKTVKDLLEFKGIKNSTSILLGKTGGDELFAIAVKIQYAILRLQEFTEGIYAAFRAVAEGSKASAIMKELGEHFSWAKDLVDLFSGATETNSENMDKWRAMGNSVGQALGSLALNGLYVMLFFLDFSSALKNSVLPVLDSLVKLVQWISENVFGKFISSGSAVGWMLGTYLKYKALSFFFGLGFVQAILWKLIMTFPLFTISALLSLQSIGEGVVAFGALLWSSIIKPLALFAAGAFVLIMVLDLLLAAFMKLGEYFGGEKYSYEKHSLVNKTMGLAGLDVKGIGKKFFETDEGGTLAGGGIRQSKQGMGAPPEHGNTYDANLTIGGQTFTPGMLEDMLKAANNRSMDPTEQAALLKDIAAAVRGQQTQGSTAGYPIMIDP